MTYEIMEYTFKDNKDKIIAVIKAPYKRTAMDVMVERKHTSSIFELRGDIKSGKIIVEEKAVKNE